MNRSRTICLAGVLTLAALVFGAGYAAGQAATNPFAMPRSIIHVSLIKWKEGTSEADRAAAILGVKKMASQIPGIKNIWIKVARMQPRDFHAAFVVEFKDRAAADLYVEHPAHEKWRKHFLEMRETSISPQITNE
jgi:hypothetical protein